jgi:hypothetical protein
MIFFEKYSTNMDAHIRVHTLNHYWRRGLSSQTPGSKCPRFEPNRDQCGALVPVHHENPLVPVRLDPLVPDWPMGQKPLVPVRITNQD